MKPTFPTVNSRGCDSFDALCGSRRLPVTDYNYQSGAFEESSGCYLRSRPRSFWNITGDYFKTEARYALWGETALFSVLALLAFLPLIGNAHALMEFVRAIGGN